MLIQLLKEFLSIVKLEGSLPSSSQVPTTGNYYEPNESNPYSENLFMCNPFSLLSKWSLSFRFSD
jgi:hypothetical protein